MRDMQDPSPVDLLRAFVMSDAELQARLAGIADAGRFRARVLDLAHARGIALDAEMVDGAMRPDPLGVGRWNPAPANGSEWPPAAWLPVQVVPGGDQTYVDWAYFGAERLREPFFEGSVRIAQGRPFNRFFRYRTTLENFLARAPDVPPRRPAGLIFHMSRCGSTLLSQMLASVDGDVAISEAPPIDDVVQLCRANPRWSADTQGALLAAMIAAFARPRAEGDRQLFFKLDSWHTLALPLFGRACPSVPWVFLYRDPVEVLVSQMRQPGIQMVPGYLPSQLFGIDGHAGMATEVYCAHVLKNICCAARDADVPNGIFVNYRELPDAVWTRVLPHFNMTSDPAGRAAMVDVARFDAKTPSFHFEEDSGRKHQEANAAVRAAAAQHLSAVYRDLEAMRLQRAT